MTKNIEAEKGEEQKGQSKEVKKPAKEKMVKISESEHARLIEEAVKYKDQYIRLYAEFENARKRMDREKQEFVKFANEGLITEFLGILDNLERSVEAAKVKHQDYAAFLKGIEMVMAHVHEMLKNNPWIVEILAVLSFFQVANTLAIAWLRRHQTVTKDALHLTVAAIAQRLGEADQTRRLHLRMNGDGRDGIQGDFIGMIEHEPGNLLQPRAEIVIPRRNFPNQLLMAPRNRIFRHSAGTPAPRAVRFLRLSLLQHGSIAPILLTRH